MAAHPPVCATSPSYSCECCQGWEEGRSGVSGWLVAVLMVCSDWCVEVIGYPGEGTRAAIAFLAQFTCVPSNNCDKEIHCQTGNVLEVLGT